MFYFLAHVCANFTEIGGIRLYQSPVFQTICYICNIINRE